MRKFESDRKLLASICLAAGMLLLTLVTPAAQNTPAAKPPAPHDSKLAKQYCITCHNQRAKTGGLALDSLDYDHLEKNAETWEKVIRKIKTGMMPPSGARRPERAALDAFATEIENRLDSAASR